MKEQGWDKRVFLIDGFPRNKANLEAWERIMGKEVDLEFVLYLTGVDENMMLQRIMKRAQESSVTGERVRNGDNEKWAKRRY